MLRVVLWIVLGYTLYICGCMLMELYARHRFDVQRDSEIARIADRRAHLLAKTRKASALSDMDEWLPYKTYMAGMLTGWGILAVAAGVATFRTIARRMGGVGMESAKILALGVSFPALFVFMVGVMPPLLIPKLWEQYTWLSW